MPPVDSQISGVWNGLFSCQSGAEGSVQFTDSFPKSCLLLLSQDVDDGPLVVKVS